MGTLGKVLVGCNVLGALIFMAVAGIDWGKHQVWSHAAMRFDFALDGLPVDEDETDIDGVKQVTKLSEPTLTAIFQPVGGAPVKTQAAEVQRVRDQFKREIDSAGDDNAKRQQLQRLIPLARTSDERNDLTRRIREGKIEEFTGQGGIIDQYAGKAMDKQRGGKDRDPDERRQAIAHLLFSLAPDDGKPYRAQVVSGLKYFAQEVDRQADACRDMAHPIIMAKAEDLGAFEVSYKKTMTDLQNLSDQLKDYDTELKRQQEVGAKHKALVASRESEIKKFNQDLEKARAATQAELDKLAEEQRHLFDVEKKVSRLKAKNQEMEREMRSLEKVK